MNSKPANFTDLVFKRKINTSMGEVKLNAHMLSILPEFDGHKTIQDIMDKTGIKGPEIKDALNNLYKLKLIEKIDTFSAVPVLSRDFFIEMNTLLAQSMGPISSTIIKKVVKNLNEVPEKFPVLKGDALITNVADQMYNESEKETFTQVMQKKLSLFL